jgi:hypothetical protein
LIDGVITRRRGSGQGEHDADNTPLQNGLRVEPIDAPDGENLVPVTGRSHPCADHPVSLVDDLEADAIDAPEGEELMPVTPITSMPHELAAWWRMPDAAGTLIGGTL